MKNIATLLSVSLILYCTTAFGENLFPPPEILEFGNLEASTDVDPMSPLHMGNLSVVFEKTKLATVLASVGVGEIHAQGDAASSLHWLCYTDVSKKQRLWLHSSEMGGGEYIDGFTASEISSSTPVSNQCPELPAKFKKVTLGSGIWLGSSLQLIENKLGPAIKHDGALWFIYFGKDKDFDVTSSVAVQASEGIAKTIQFYHVTSN